MNRLRLGYNLLRYLGPRILWLRGIGYLQGTLDLDRRVFRNCDWEEVELEQILSDGVPVDQADYASWKLENLPPFFFPFGKPPAFECDPSSCTRTPSLRDRLDLLAMDRCIYFLRKPSPESIDWYHNPWEDKFSDKSRSCFEIPDYLPSQGDPRVLWEPARAAWAIDCAKAAAAGDRHQGASIYWKWVDSWMAACPPFRGYHWKGGQESAVRLLAILLGFWATGSKVEIESARFAQMARLAWATGHRIYNNIHYALSLKNNHALSESLGLMLVGYLFPEMKSSPKWLARGRQVMEREISRQVYEDGSYVQHSMNYHRVMLQVTTWALRLAELQEDPFPPATYERLGKAAEFLHAMLDMESGQTPLYGNDDGAYVAPLSECDYFDFRPAVQAAYYLVHRNSLLPEGPWNEDLAWLFGTKAAWKSPGLATRSVSRAFESGGYFTLRRPDSWAMMRAHTYRDRPAHCDSLHVDLWWLGQNVLRDCGTYQYYCTGRHDVEFYFKSIRAHNSVEIDGRNPLEEVSRYLWFPWPRSEKIRFEASTDPAFVVEAVSFDYRRRPTSCVHRRTLISLEHDIWVVIDDFLGRGRHQTTLRWHMLDVPFRVDYESHSVALDTANGAFSIGMHFSKSPPDRFDVIRGRDEQGEVQGFASPCYGERVPIPTIEASSDVSFPARIVSVATPGQPPRVETITLSHDRHELAIRTEGYACRVALAACGERHGMVFVGADVAAIPLSPRDELNGG